MRKVWVVLVMSICSVAGVAQGSDEATIRKLRAESNDAIVARDIGGVSASLDGDFVMVRGNGIFATREAYIAAFTEDFKNANSIRYERVADTVEISSVAPVAAEHGHWIGHARDGRSAYSGTYLAMWRHSESGWKLRSELFVVLACGDPAFCAAYKAMAEKAK